MTLLKWAIKNEYIDIIELLIRNKVDVNSKDYYGNTALHEVKNYELSKMLISKGADVNAKNNHGSTPLHFTTIYEIAQLLIKNGADINSKNMDGYTPLHDTLNPDIAELLIKNGADVNAKTSYGYTPLHLTSKIEVAKILIKNGADINAKNKHGATPLHAVSNKEIAELLVQNNIDIHKKDIFGRTPLWHAADRGRNEVIEFLIQNGADINATDSYGKNILWNIFGVGNTADALLMNKGAIIKTLRIGNQEWMGDNLKVRFFRNGDPIPFKESSEWRKAAKNGEPAYTYCKEHYTDGEDGFNKYGQYYCAHYGYLYNWYAVNDKRGLAPYGWHIPSLEEWKLLSGYKLKEIGFFTQNGGGYCDLGSNFCNTINDAYFWSATQKNEAMANNINIGDKGWFAIREANKYVGCSIRCIKDEIY